MPCVVVGCMRSLWLLTVVVDGLVVSIALNRLLPQHANENATDPALRDTHAITLDFHSNSVLREVDVSFSDPPLRICDARVPQSTSELSRCVSVFCRRANRSAHMLHLHDGYILVCTLPACWPNRDSSYFAGVSLVAP